MGSTIFIFNKYLYYRVKDCELCRSLSEREGCPIRPSAGLGGQKSQILESRTRLHVIWRNLEGIIYQFIYTQIHIFRKKLGFFGF